MKYFFSTVIPAKAGIQKKMELMDPRLRGDDIFQTLLHFCLLSFFFFSITTLAQEAPSGYDIAKKQQDVDNGYHDESSIGHMYLISSSGGSVEREFESRKLEKKGSDGEKSLIRFIKPADIQNTALLSIQNKNRDDDQWFYLPAMQKTRRISGSGKNGSFVGSEFSFEDLIPADIDKYSYQYKNTEACGESTCFVVESIPKDTDSGYSKTVSWIRTDIYKTVKADFYDKKSRLEKTAIFTDFQVINGRFNRPFTIVMENHLTNKKTKLTMENLKIGTGLTDADFSERALAR